MQANMPASSVNMPDVPGSAVAETVTSSSSDQTVSGAKQSACAGQEGMIFLPRRGREETRPTIGSACRKSMACQSEL